jgi:hypothetical protein
MRRLGLALLLRGAQVLCGQAAALPTAEAVLDRFIAVTGGQAAYDRIENRTIEATTSTLLGITLARNTEYVTRAGSYRNIVTGLAATEFGLNDGVAWMSAAGKSEIVEAGPERALILRSAVFLADSQWRRYYSSVKMAGVKIVAGKRCYEIEAKLAAGGSQTLGYEIESGLLLRHTEDNAEITAEEYFAVEGIRMPRRCKMSTYGIPLTITIDRVAFNRQIPESTFALPPEIARLAGKRWMPPPNASAAAARP